MQVYHTPSHASYTMQCSAVQCSAVQCSAVQCSAVQCSAVQCSAVQCSAVQCNAIQYNNTYCPGPGNSFFAAFVINNIKFSSREV